MKHNEFTLLSVVIGFILGVSISYKFDWLNLICNLLITIFFLLIFKKKKVAVCFLITFFLGCVIGLIKIEPNLDETEITGIIIESKTNYFIVQSGFNRYYVYYYGNTLQVGDIVKITGYFNELKFAKYESRFDTEEYLNFKGVFYQFVSKNTEYVFEFPIRLRELENSFTSNFDSETKALLDSILFSRKNYDSSVISNSSALGIINLLSTSGLLVGAFLRLLESLFFLKLSEKKSLIASTLCGIIVLPFSFGKIGVIKTFILRFLRILNWKNRRFTYIELLSISALILIVFDYHNVFQTGFLLSYGVSLILFLSSYTIKRYKPFQRKIVRYFLVQLIMIPVTISYSNGLHLLTPIVYILLLPLIEVFALIGLISFFIYPFTNILNFIGTIISKLIYIFYQTDLYVPLSISNLFPYLYYVILFVCLYIHEVGDLKVRNIMVFVSIGLYLFTYIPIYTCFTKEVTFINVGQGDCCLIRDRNYTVMIDTGGTTTFDIATECLIPYLRKRRIYKIDYLIGTHSDNDHVGGVSSLMKYYNVGEYITLDESFPLKIGDINLTNYNKEISEDENDCSLVLGMDFIGYKWLFMGDASTTIEANIIEEYPSIDCDILKIGHHGSKTSSSLSFLKKVTPDVAIISVGEKNSYGHPSEEVIQRLESLNITIRRTDLEGTISYFA